jgi:hypothetical protein
MDPVYHFVKTRAGEYHTGIPARDLAEEDLAGLSEEQRATVEASPLYRKIERPPTDETKPAGRAEKGGGN